MPDVEISMEEMLAGLRKKVANKVSFSPAEWEDFSARWQRVSYEKDHQLIQPGEVEHWFYYIYHGVTRGYFLHNGQDRSGGFAYNGDFLSSIDSWISRKPTILYLECLSPVQALRIHHSDLNEMYDRYKFVERWGRLLMEELLWGLGMRELSILSYSAEERYDRLMKNAPHILQLVPQKHLASYLGMTPETFSRIRRKRSRS